MPKTNAADSQATRRPLLTLTNIGAFFSVLTVLWLSCSYAFFAGEMMHMPSDVWALVTFADVSGHFLTKSFWIVLGMGMIALSSTQLLQVIPQHLATGGTLNPRGSKSLKITLVSAVFTGVLVLNALVLLSSPGNYLSKYIPEHSYLKENGFVVYQQIQLLVFGIWFFSDRYKRHAALIVSAGAFITAQVLIFFWGEISGASTFNRSSTCAVQEQAPACKPVQFIGERYLIVHTGPDFTALPTNKTTVLHLSSRR